MASSRPLSGTANTAVRKSFGWIRRRQENEVKSGRWRNNEKKSRRIFSWLFVDTLHSFYCLQCQVTSSDSPSSDTQKSPVVIAIRISLDQDTDKTPIAAPDQAMVSSMTARVNAANGVGALNTSEASIPCNAYNDVAYPSNQPWHE